MTQHSGLGMLPTVGLVIVVLSVVGGLLYWWLRPDPRIALVLAISALIGTGVFAGFLWQSNRQSEFVTAMQRDGLRGVATIVRVDSTNLIVNRRPQVRLQTRIDLPGRPTYEQEILELVPFGQAALPGRKLTVYVDPNDGSKILFDWASAPPDLASTSTGTPTAHAGSLADRLGELEDAKKKGLITESEYRKQRERLLSGL